MHLTGKKFGAEIVKFYELLRRSDFVFVSCPLTSETRGMFDRNAFTKMKPLSVFIDVARGGKHCISIHPFAQI